MKTSIVAGFVVLVLASVGCAQDGGGDRLCAKIQACAEKSATSFSQTECKDGFGRAQEEADTAGCGDEYVDYMDCVGALEFSCDDDLSSRIDAECGAKAKRLSSCTGGPVLLAKNECELAVERIAAKNAECFPDAAADSGADGDDSDVECSSEQAASATKAADCWTAAPCAALTGADSEASAALSACWQ